MSNPHLTVGETARLYDVAQWRIRKIVDELDADIPRAGMYRLIPPLPRVDGRGSAVRHHRWPDHCEEDTLGFRLLRRLPSIDRFGSHRVHSQSLR